MIMCMIILYIDYSLMYIYNINILKNSARLRLIDHFQNATLDTQTLDSRLRYISHQIKKTCMLHTSCSWEFRQHKLKLELSDSIRNTAMRVSRAIRPASSPRSEGNSVLRAHTYIYTHVYTLWGRLWSRISTRL